MKKVLASVIIMVFVCSCTPALVKINANLMDLEPGMTKDEVTTIMGVPTLSELYETVDGDLVSILYYRTHKQESTLLSIKDVCTPVVFVDGQLVGWGDRLTTSGLNLLEVTGR